MHDAVTVEMMRHFDKLLELCSEGIERQMLERLYEELPSDIFIRLFAQYRVGECAFLITPDFAFPDEKIAIFCDSSTYHRYERALKSDNCVTRELQRHGWLVLRFRTCEIRYDRLVMEIRDDFRHRHARRLSNLT